MQTEKFNVNGMGCANCAKTIQNALLNVEGVKEAQVDFANKVAEVAYEDATVTKEKLQAAVSEAGYELQV